MTNFDFVKKYQIQIFHFIDTLKYAPRKMLPWEVRVNYWEPMPLAKYIPRDVFGKKPRFEVINWLI